jgi:N-hydroxyarylamine O-acetyltransferase
LQAKLVHGRRGGRCTEQNTLLAAALEALGFPVTRLAGRVRLGATTIRPRGHMLLRVEAGESAWLADVGFGGNGLLKPMPLVAGTTARQYHWDYRVTEEPGLLVLQARTDSGWLDLYAFSLEPCYHADYELIAHFYATHPSSIFVQRLTFQRPTPEARYILRSRELTVERPDGTETRSLTDEELWQVLSQDIGLDIPREALDRALRKIPVSAGRE